MEYSWKNELDDNRCGYDDIVINNSTGKEYKLFIGFRLNPELDDNIFIRWAICTTKNFVGYIDSSRITKNMLEYIINNFQFPEIFDEYNLQGLMNRDLWERAIDRNANVLRYLTNYYWDNEKLEKLSNLKNVELKGNIYNYITKEIFEKIYFNCDNEHRKRFIYHPDLNSIQVYCGQFNKKLYELITPEIAEDLLSLDITLLWQIPKEYISKENAIKAMNYDIRLLQFVPAEYQTNEYQKQLIDKYTRLISSIDSNALTDETIFYALSKANVLKLISRERRTLEVCKYAIDRYPKALKSVPRNILTEEMCLDAIKKEPILINNVPVEFLTKSFIEELYNNNVVIPNNCKNYIKLCLETNGKLEDTISINEDNNIYPVNNDDSFNVRLDLYDGLFSEELADLLKQLNINTVGDLIQEAEDNNFYSSIINISDKYYKELEVAVRLLKSKYLNVDPLINIVNEDSMYNLCSELAFSKRTTNALARTMYNQNEFLEIMRDKDKHYLLQRIRGLGQKSINEIITKMTFVVDYYDKQKEDDKSLSYLYKELEDLRRESLMLDKRIDQLLIKIKQKEEMDKGGISR